MIENKLKIKYFFPVGIVKKFTNPEYLLAKEGQQFASVEENTSKKQALFQLKRHYFSGLQLSRIISFFEIRHNAAFIDIEQVLALSYLEPVKKTVQDILCRFVQNLSDPIKTAKKLTELADTLKPLFWQVRRRKRYANLKIFIENFKKECLREILQRHAGYQGAQTVFEAENELTYKSAANSRLIVKPEALSAQDKQKRSLFLVNSEDNKNIGTEKAPDAQERSFFKR